MNLPNINSTGENKHEYRLQSDQYFPFNEPNKGTCTVEKEKYSVLKKIQDLLVSTKEILDGNFIYLCSYEGVGDVILYVCVVMKASVTCSGVCSIWNKVFKNRPSKILGKQPQILKWYDLVFILENFADEGK